MVRAVNQILKNSYSNALILNHPNSPQTPQFNTKNVHLFKRPYNTPLFKHPNSPHPSLSYAPDLFPMSSFIYMFQFLISKSPPPPIDVIFVDFCQKMTSWGGPF